MGEEYINIQKCTIKLNGEPLIRQSVNGLIQTGIKEIILLTGHKAEQVEACFNESSHRKHLKFVFCGDPYKIPLNTISTLAHAKDYICGTFLCLHGDILVNNDAIVGLIADFNRYLPLMTITVSNIKEIAPTHARVEYDENLLVRAVKTPEDSNADVWVGIDAYHPSIIARYCTLPNVSSQGHLARAILTEDGEIRAFQYNHRWIHLVDTNK
ncbi:hypothetical protein JW766_04120 [Candidatus Dojkabacteria bacterium]|nr:hypothetical protein [Candidatus Dojkabacteria bacterium]